MTTKFILTRDINGNVGYGLPFSDFAYQALIVADTAASLTIPAIPDPECGKWLAVFSFEPGAAVWVAKKGTAEIPGGASFSSTTSELNPTAREVEGGDVLSFITGSTTAQVGVTLYAIQRQ